MFKILSPSPIVGYGFEKASLAFGTAMGDLDVVACDAGSTDPGPFYLGTNELLCPPAAVERDLRGMLQIARANGSRIVIGTCGGSGTNAQVDWMYSLTRRLCSEEGWPARIALVYSEVPAQVLRAAIDEGRVFALDGTPPLGPRDVDAATRTVAMMGVEPVQQAFAEGAEIVLAGRISDAAIFAAPAIDAGVQPGAAWCAGKLLECGAVCTDPFGMDSVIAEFDGDSFELYPPNDKRRCTRESVLAQFLHENANPLLHPEPSGVLDLSAMRVEEVDSRRVRISGCEFTGADSYSVKLEGVLRRGHRVVLLGATRDPGVIARLDAYVAEVAQAAEAKLAASRIPADEYELLVRVYGRDGVMGANEPAAGTRHEVALVYEIIADTQDRATTVAKSLRSLMLHTEFAGRLCTEGNFALPFSPAELDGGEAFEFSIWHRMEIDDPLTLFPVVHLAPDTEVVGAS